MTADAPSRAAVLTLAAYEVVLADAPAAAVLTLAAYAATVLAGTVRQLSIM